MEHTLSSSSIPAVETSAQSSQNLKQDRVYGLGSLNKTCLTSDKLRTPQAVAPSCQIWPPAPRCCSDSGRLFRRYGGPKKSSLTDYLIALNGDYASLYGLTTITSGRAWFPETSALELDTAKRLFMCRYDDQSCTAVRRFSKSSTPSIPAYIA